MLLGREPRGPFEVVVTDESGGPVVIRNGPVLDDGTPMPTRYWLVGKQARLAIDRLESAGGVSAAEAAVAPAELERARPGIRRRARRRASGIVGGAAAKWGGGGYSAGCQVPACPLRLVPGGGR